MKREQATRPGQPNQTKPKTNHLTISTYQTVAVLEGSPWRLLLSLRLLGCDRLHQHHQPDLQLVQLRVRLQLHLPLLARGAPGGEDRLQSFDRLFIHSPPQLTSSLVDNHLPSNIFIPYPHHQRVNFNFVVNFVTKKGHFSFHFHFLRIFASKSFPILVFLNFSFFS